MEFSVGTGDVVLVAVEVPALETRQSVQGVRGVELVHVRIDQVFLILRRPDVIVGDWSFPGPNLAAKTLFLVTPLRPDGVFGRYTSESLSLQVTIDRRFHGRDRFSVGTTSVLVFDYVTPTRRFRTINAKITMVVLFAK